MRVSVNVLFRNPIEFDGVRNLFETDKYGRFAAMRELRCIQQMEKWRVKKP